MSNPELDKIMGRIQKMLNLAADSGATPEEAATAASMAEKLMRKYQLEHSDLIIAEMGRSDGMATEDVVATAKTNGTKVEAVPLWASLLGANTAKLCGCGAIIGRTPSTFEACMRFVGFKADTQMASWMYSYLIQTVNALCLNFRSTGAYAVGGRRAASAYRLGVAEGICSKIRREIEERERELAATIQRGNELMIIKKELIVQQFGNVFDYGKANTAINMQSNSFGAGLRDGRNVDLNRRGIEGSQDQNLRLSHEKG